MASKTAATNGPRRRSPARKSVVVKQPARRESWKKVFERHLVRAGYSPAEAKEIVADVAS